MDLAESERFLAIRTLYMGEDFTLDILACATGRAPSALVKAAKRYGWPRFKSSQSEGTTPAQLLKRIEILVDDKLSNGIAVKADVDEVLSLLRLVEKMKILTPPEGPVKDDNAPIQQDTAHDAQQSPDKIRAILRQLDEQIQVLAERRAEFLLSEKGQQKPVSAS